MVSSRRFAAGKSYGIDAIGQACGIDGAVDRVVRLDSDRFSTRAAARRYERLEPAGGWYSAGCARRYDKKTRVAARLGYTRSLETAGTGVEQLRLHRPEQLLSTLRPCAEHSPSQDRKSTRLN